jgi:hypothetical protein
MKNRLCATLPFSIKTMLVVLILLSCGSEEEEDALHYPGTWQFKDKIYSGELVFNTTRTLILTRTTYQEIYVVQRDNSSDVMTLLGLKGDISVNGNFMTFQLSAIGECVKDNTEQCTSAVQWFQKGSSTYNSYLQFVREQFTSEFYADEDSLWLIRDMNNDSDTDDPGEDIEFLRL